MIQTYLPPKAADSQTGVSLAVSSDPSGVRFLVDLTSDGKLRIRKSSAGSREFSAPTTLNAKPLADSPITVLHWIEGNGDIIVRIYYVAHTFDGDAIFETGAKLSSTSTGPGTWFNGYIKIGSYRSPIINTGGLSAVYVGNYNIRIYYRTNQGNIGELGYYPSNNAWRISSFGRAPAGTHISATNLLDSEGNFAGISTVYFKGNTLEEIQYTLTRGDWFFGKIPHTIPNLFFILYFWFLLIMHPSAHVARYLDPTWSGAGVPISQTYGNSPIDTRIFFVNDTDWTEKRGAGFDGEYGPWTTPGSKFSEVPTYKYGAIAATSWGQGTEDSRVEIFYVEGSKIRQVLYNGEGTGEWTLGSLFDWCEEYIK